MELSQNRADNPSCCKNLIVGCLLMDVSSPLIEIRLGPLEIPHLTFPKILSSAESQKGTLAVQQCSTENQKGTTLS